MISRLVYVRSTCSDLTPIVDATDWHIRVTSDIHNFCCRPGCAQTAEWACSKRCLEVTTLELGKHMAFAESASDFRQGELAQARRVELRVCVEI